MGRTRVHESAGDATLRKRAVQREKLTHRAAQSAQNGGDAASCFGLARCTGTQIVTVFTGKLTDVHGSPTTLADMVRTESLRAMLTKTAHALRA